MDPIQETIDIATGDAQASIEALSQEVSALRDELAGARGELEGASEGAEDLGGASAGATKGMQGLSRGGISGVASALRVVNPELGGAVMMFGAMQAGLPKLAASLKALPAALGPIGIAAMAAAAAFAAITFATRKLGEELDELDRKIAANFANQEQLRKGSDSLKDMTADLLDEYALLSGELTKAEIAQRDFNAEVDRSLEAQLRSGLLTEKQAEAVRERAAAVKEQFAENQRLRAAQEAQREAARRAAEAQREAADAAEERQRKEAELLETQRQARAEEQRRAAALGQLASVQSGLGSVAAEMVAAFEEFPAEEIGRAVEQAMKQARIEVGIETAGSILQTGGDPLALLGMAGPVGAGVSAGLGGLASLGEMSDEDIDAQFGGLADSIIAGIERLPDLLGPLVVDFAIALATQLPRAILEAGAGLLRELVALLFPRRADADPGNADMDATLAAIAENEERRAMQEAATSHNAFRTSASDLSGIDAAPALARAFGQSPRRGGSAGGGRMELQLRQAGIFGTTQQIEIATGAGGLREKT